MDRVVAGIRAAGEAVASYDIGRREGADGIVWTALSKLGAVDVLDNNAGIRAPHRPQPHATTTSIASSRCTSAAPSSTQAAARAMKVQGRGGPHRQCHSLSGLVGNFGQANYGAAKAACHPHLRRRLGSRRSPSP